MPGALRFGEMLYHTLCPLPSPLFVHELTSLLTWSFLSPTKWMLGALFVCVHPLFQSNILFNCDLFVSHKNHKVIGVKAASLLFIITK